jgi:hypothetical protein
MAYAVMLIFILSAVSLLYGVIRVSSTQDNFCFILILCACCCFVVFFHSTKMLFIPNQPEKYTVSVK